MEILLSLLQIQIVRYMQNKQSYYFNVNDSKIPVPHLKDRGFWTTMANLEKKDIVMRQYETNNGIPTFLGFRLTERGKLIKI